MKNHHLRDNTQANRIVSLVFLFSSESEWNIPKGRGICKKFTHFWWGSKNATMQKCMAHRIHVCSICLHLVDLYGKLVGKYNSPMDPSWVVIFSGISGKKSCMKFGLVIFVDP